MQLKQFYQIATKVSSRKKCYYFWWSTWLLSWFVSGHSVCSRFGSRDSGSNRASSRGRQFVSFRFENRLPVPEHRNWQQTCMHACTYARTVLLKYMYCGLESKSFPVFRKDYINLQERVPNAWWCEKIHIMFQQLIHYRLSWWGAIKHWAFVILSFSQISAIRFVQSQWSNQEPL